MKAGVVWINSTNLFDAAAGFGGYRESGFGREGGREGLYEYLVPTGEKAQGAGGREAAGVFTAAPAPTATTSRRRPRIDRTAKLYIGGKQARPDSGYSYTVRDATGAAGRAGGLGNRKDIRNAVEAAAKAGGWGAATAHNRAQVLYYLAENLSARADEFAARLRSMTGASKRSAAAEEVAAAVRRIFFYAAQADKYDGAVHATRSRHVTLAMNEPWGVMGIALPGRGAAARLRLAGHAGDRHGQPRRRRAVAGRIRWPRPISIRCSTRATCRAAWSTSSPASATCWPRRSPSTTTSPRSGISARRTAARWSRRPRPAISRRPGSITAARVDWSDPAEGQGREYPAPRHPGEEHLGALRRVGSPAS